MLALLCIVKSSFYEHFTSILEHTGGYLFHFSIKFILLLLRELTRGSLHSPLVFLTVQSFYLGLGILKFTERKSGVFLII